MNLNEHKFFVGSAFFLIGAVIFAGGLVYLVHARSTAVPVISSQTDRAPHVVSDAPHYPANLSPVSGTIVSSTANTITVNTSRPPQDANPSADDQETFEIGSRTQIYTQGADKSQEEYQAEIEAFQQQIATAYAGDVTYIGPDPFEHVAVSLSDLAPGTPVVVTPQSIDSNNNVTAMSVFVVPQKN